jgi:hypothetical protein
MVTAVPRPHIVRRASGAKYRIGCEGANLAGAYGGSAGRGRPWLPPRVGKWAPSEGV